MTTIEGIKALVKTITTLSNALPPSVPKGTTKDKIWTVFHRPECENPFETFNKRFDALFAEDCRDSTGHLHYIRSGKSGMGIVCSYLKKINWAELPLNLVETKLERLNTELSHIMYVPIQLRIVIC
jgi:hypothetical protein